MACGSHPFANGSIWLYGLPEGSTVDVYAMYLSDLAPFVKSYPVRRFVGEFNVQAVLVPKWQFLGQEFVKKFSSILACHHLYPGRFQ